MTFATPGNGNYMAFPEKIEILSVEYLDQNRSIVTNLKRLAASLHQEFGWHYLLDLSWTILNLGPVKGLKVLDAGAGVGILQWYLAQAGAEVVSVDRMSRAMLPLRFRNRFNVHGLRKLDLQSSWRVLVNYATQSFDRFEGRQLASRVMAFYRDLKSCLIPTQCTGSVAIYHQDLSNLVDLPDGTFDAVVSISALEHNPPENLEMVVHELMRVLKPCGALIATLVAARDQDWYHQPSSGWCYSENSLRRLFKLDHQVPSNYFQYDELFQSLKDCAELRDHLARFYYQSADKGMPGGVWNPEYQPVGVIKIRK